MKNLFHPFIQKYKNSHLLALLLGFGLAVLAVGPFAEFLPDVLADTNNPNAPGGGGTGSGVESGGVSSGLGTVISGLATLFLKLIGGILWAVLYWMGDLMDNTFILEGEIGEKLRSVWVIVRNFVNIFFALMLVVAALMSVIGYGDESGNYAMKKFIPKMALALIAVNFTFFACRIVLDLNNVLTTAIFSIPQSVTNLTDIGPTGSAGVKIFKKFKCLSGNESIANELERVQKINKLPGFENVIASLGGVCFAEFNPDAPGADPARVLREEVDTLDSTKFTKKDFVWAMATQFQGIHSLNQVAQLSDRSFTTLTVNALFSIIFAVIYATAYIAMFIILIGRMIMIWIFVMLSPLAAVDIVIPDLLPEQLSISKFINQAFVPAKMAIPLSFGYILLSQMAISIDINSNIVSDRVIDLNATGEFARDISITSIMYGAASIGIIWTGVFTASKDVLGSGLVEQMEGFVKGAGQTVAKWPTYLPIMPVVGGGLASPQTILAGVSELRSAIAEQHRRSDEEIIKNQLDALGLVRSDAQRLVGDIRRGIDAGSMNTATAGKIRDLANASPREFHQVARMLSDNRDRFSPQDRANIAQAMGFSASDDGFRQFQEMLSNNRNGLLEQVKNTATPTGPAVSTPNYADIASGTLRSGNVDLSSDEIFNSLSEETRRSMGINDRTKAQNFSITQDIDFGSFVSNLRDQGKITPQALRQMVSSQFLENLVTNNPTIQPEMAKDGELLRRILRLKSSDPALNTKIRSLYKAITKLEDPELENKTGITSSGALKT